jgi:hypothetical protein
MLQLVHVHAGFANRIHSAAVTLLISREEAKSNQFGVFHFPLKQVSSDYVDYLPR